MDALDDLAIYDDLFRDDSTNDQFVEQTVFKQSCELSSADLTILIDGLNILEILQEDLYRKTYPLNDRNILDAPFIRPYRWHIDWCSKLGVSLFYNQTGRMFFTKNCDNLSSYLSICNSNLLRKLSAITSQEFIREATGDNFNMCPLCIFPLFKNMTVQERKSGFMLWGSQAWNCWTFRAYVPLYYIERNFFMTDQERKRTEAILGESDPQFQDQHLISDKFGFGDTRLICAYHAYRSECMDVNAGIQFTIPTAFAFKKGLKGSSFSQWKKLRRCKFNLEELWCLAQEDTAAATEYASDFFLGALDTLSANLLDVPLGNDQHPGIGVFTQTRSRWSTFIHRPWADNVQYMGTLSLEYLLPRYETRFFSIKADNSQLQTNLYDNERALDDDEYVDYWVNLIEDTFTNKLYPVALKTRIQPGIIFHWTSNFFIEHKNWRYQLGTDWYIQGSDSIEAINVPQNIGAGNIDIRKAKQSFIYQSKVCGGLFYSIVRPTHEWNISLFADYTYWTKGMGNDFTLVFNWEVNF